ncbi:MAG: hypothetical protein D6731_16325 [Planctomycetota bacterium]|nr:MAG: hypothetical protein D6731_16325 [Planctomycetota bacterium]
MVARALPVVWLFLPAAVWAAPAGERSPRPRLDLRSRTDLGHALGPEGVFSRTEVAWRRTFAQDPSDLAGDRCGEVGVATRPTRSLARAGLHGERRRWPWLFLRLQADLGALLGAYGALLRFEDPGRPFGDAERRARSEEVGFGKPMLLRPTLRWRRGPLTLWGQVDLAFYRLPPAARRRCSPSERRRIGWTGCASASATRRSVR